MAVAVARAERWQDNRPSGVAGPEAVWLCLQLEQVELAQIQCTVVAVEVAAVLLPLVQPLAAVELAVVLGLTQAEAVVQVAEQERPEQPVPTTLDLSRRRAVLAAEAEAVRRYHLAVQEDEAASLEAVVAEAERLIAGQEVQEPVETEHEAK